MTLSELLDALPAVGRLEWIGRASARRAAIESLTEVRVEVGTGLEGEHHARGGGGRRQVTLVQAEHLDVIGRLLGREPVAPERLRRNLVVAGINLIALKGRVFRIGEVLLEGTGPCEPCSRLEEELGPGGFQAARGHGGITARVLRGGTLRVGDAVSSSEQESGGTGA